MSSAFDPSNMQGAVTEQHPENRSEASVMCRGIGLTEAQIASDEWVGTLHGSLCPQFKNVWVNVTSVIEHFEWSVDWKSIIEMQVHLPRWKEHSL